MKDEAYSHLKALRHLDILQGAKMGTHHRPAHIMFHVTDLCNHACNFCSYRSPGFTNSQTFKEYDPGGKKGLRKPGYEDFNFNPNRMIPLEKVCEILDDCKAMSVSGVTFTGGGEPTIHPQFAKILEHTISLGLPFSVVTNGSMVKTRGLENLLAQAEWLRFSINAGDAETYAKVHNVPESVFWDALDSVNEVYRAAAAQKSKVVIGVNFVITPDNWRGIVEACRHAKAYGADGFRVTAQYSENGESLFTGFYDEVMRLCEEAKLFETDTFEVITRFGGRVEELKQGSPDYKRCGYQEFTTVIGADLNLYRCVIYAYNDRGAYASIKDQRFKGAWYGKNRPAEFRDFDARGCAVCQYNGINRNLDYALQEKDPKHSEFV